MLTNPHTGALLFVVLPVLRHEAQIHMILLPLVSNHLPNATHITFSPDIVEATRSVVGILLYESSPTVALREVEDAEPVKTLF